MRLFSNKARRLIPLQASPFTGHHHHHPGCSCYYAASSPKALAFFSSSRWPIMSHSVFLRCCFLKHCSTIEVVHPYDPHICTMYSVCKCMLMPFASFFFCRGKIIVFSWAGLVWPITLLGDLSFFPSIMSQNSTQNKNTIFYIFLVNWHCKLKRLLGLDCKRKKQKTVKLFLQVYSPFTCRTNGFISQNHLLINFPIKLWSNWCNFTCLLIFKNHRIPESEEKYTKP